MGSIGLTRPLMARPGLGIFTVVGRGQEPFATPGHIAEREPTTHVRI
jgi:hypothetical protein